MDSNSSKSSKLITAAELEGLNYYPKSVLLETDTFESPITGMSICDVKVDNATFIAFGTESGQLVIKKIKE